MMPKTIKVKDAQAAISQIIKAGETRAWINTERCLTIMPGGVAVCIHWGGNG